MIQQREIGRDTPSWKEAMRRLLRQNPDVIMLSEIRDPEVMMMALSAANTGHLVLSTLSAMDAGQTINRMISLAPGELVGEIRYLIASALAGIVSQRLLPRQNSGGRVPAVEVLIATEKVTKLILNPEQLLHVRQVIHESHGTHGMQTFDQSLGDLQQAGLISLEEALKHASSPTDFRFRMKGVKSGMNWTEFGEDGQN
jgi:twitching motility protein PilT